MSTSECKALVLTAFYENSQKTKKTKTDWCYSEVTNDWSSNTDFGVTNNKKAKRAINKPAGLQELGK